MASAAQSITLQLNSATATATSEGAYRLALEPPIDIPYLSEPRASLSDMAFVNTAINVSRKIGNNTVDIELVYFKSIKASVTVPPLERHDLKAKKTYTIVIPDGHYSVTTLETAIAKQVYTMAAKTGDVAASYRVDDTSSLWQDMSLLCRHEPVPATLEVLHESDIVDTNGVDVSVWTITAKAGGAYIDTLPHTYLGANVAVVEMANLGIITYIDDLGTTFHTSAAFTVFPNPDGSPPTLPMAVTPAQDTADGALVNGFGVHGVAMPALSPSSHWAEVLQIEEMELIATTKGAAANHAVVTVDNTAQNQRFVRPMYLEPDQHTGRMQVVLAYPGFLVQASSTLFSKVLGFDAADYGTGGDTQDPFLHAGRLWTAGREGTLQRVRSVVFHCPTLISSSYDQTGKRSGAQLGVVPVTVPANTVQVWQAAYNNSLPCALHGGSVSQIEFYIRDQDLNPVDLQGTAFQATIQLSWPDPRPPTIGSAGADAETAFGLNDINYGYRR